MTRARLAGRSGGLGLLLLPLAAVAAVACSAPRGGPAAASRSVLDAPPPVIAAEGAGAGPGPGKHRLHAMFGGTVGRDDDGLALGAAWEYRSTDRVGLGAFGDVVLGSPSTTLLGGAGYFHLTEKVTVLAGPGLRFHRGDTSLFGRVGGWYEFPMGDWTMGPAVFLDLGLGDVGATFALAFGFDF